MQSTNSILMIKPTKFNYNGETAVNNYYQQASDLSEANEIQREALNEFNGFVDTLKRKGINVIDIEDRHDSISPDSIFPNNWISFHESGRVAFYPMFAKNRRLERRDDILIQLKERGYRLNTIRDYSRNEISDTYLEGTGSMIFDRENKKAYCAISPRADIELFKEFCSDFGYTPVYFNSYQSVDEKRLPIYHTNVMMAVGSEFAIICADSIDDEIERKNIINSLKADGKEIVYISELQVESFAGNALEVRKADGDAILVMSKTAFEVLEKKQIEQIEKYTEILPINVSTIEKYGGGSVRCMMAEVFLPKM